MCFSRIRSIVYPLAFASTLVLACPSVLIANDRPGNVSKELRGQAIDVLRKALKNDSLLVKVHAAEFLLKLDYPQGVAEVFTQELKKPGDAPIKRIVIWRVLACASLREIVPVHGAETATA